MTPSDIPCTYIGGVRWRWGNASKPLARLSIDVNGIEAALRGPRLISRLRVSVSWTEIERVHPVRGLLPIPGNVGVAFYSDDRLVFWSSPKDRDQILQDVQRLAPAAVLVRTQTKYVF